MATPLMMRLLITFLCLMATIPAVGSEPTIEQLEESLRITETAFAQTMADRDLEAFATFLDETAIFSTSRRVLRGRDEIVEGWRPLYESPDAPFSWRPVRVHVLDGGRIGGTTGPVIDRDGNIVGQFVSTWKRQPDGTWKIILDLAPDCQ